MEKVSRANATSVSADLGFEHISKGSFTVPLDHASSRNHIASAATSLTKLAQNWSRDLLAITLPARCLHCRRLLEPDQSGFCFACNTALDAIAAAPACSACAAPLAQGAVCPYCMGKSYKPFSRIVALGVYHEALKEAILRFKFRGRWMLAGALARKLYEQPRVRLLLSQVDCLCPTPLHWTRHIGRGFDQSRLLASHLSRLSGVPVVHPAFRHRATAPQTTVRARAHRRANVRNAFCLKDPKLIYGKRVAVVDDVLTTAATLRSLAEVLKFAAPADMCAIVLAVADPLGRGFQAI
jgi:ComF family protein